MKPLAARIAAEIAAAGPMSVADFMARALFDPAAGYYTTREPFGARGDFVTAPEVSQMFGELCAVWLYAAWQASGAPPRPLIAEIGPGRGTLMKDLLRALRQIDAAMLAGARIFMVEASPRLCAVQRATLAGAPAMPQWCARIDDLPGGPLFILGNELFDAIPIRQYVRTAAGWRERAVGLGDGGALVFLAGAGTPDPALLPAAAATAPEGAIVEIAPARTALMEAIARRISDDGGAALFIDYGHPTAAVGDTLQAVRGHAYADVLSAPGTADLTAHVDFSALVRAAEARGLSARLMDQGDFLLGLGLLERAGRLGAAMDEAGREAVRQAVERLAGADAMGRLFKVLAVTARGVAVPPFESAAS